MHPRFRLTMLTAAALFMWAGPALATRHGGEIPIVGLLLFVVAVPTVFPLVPVVCGMAVHAALMRRFLAAAIIGGSGVAAAWSIVQLIWRGGFPAHPSEGRLEEKAAEPAFSSRLNSS